jgi:hypothetical protein
MSPKNKKVKNETVNTDESAKEILDLETDSYVSTTMQFNRGDLDKLRVEAAKQDSSMAGILRGLLRNHFAKQEGVSGEGRDSDVYSEADRLRDLVEDRLPKILNDCTEGLIGQRFNFEKFIDSMLDNDISLKSLTTDEWADVESKLENISFEGSRADFVDLFLPLKPTRSQVRDLRSLHNRLSR